jgi:hypothetical protein
MSVLTVGVGKEFQTIQSAVAASKAGDTIEVEAGTYTVADLNITHDLTIEASGNGPVNVVAPGTIAYGGNVSKGLFVVGSDTTAPNVTIEGLSFSGAKSAQSNGAGVRYQSGNLTLVDDSFSNNQDGLAAWPFVQNTGTVIVQGCTFNHNGAGDGQSHNLYIGEINTFIMENSVSENANVGHEVKDRAFNSIIENNLITDTATGNASYSIDLPDGGNALIQGNTIVKGPDASTSTVIHIGGGEQQNGGTTTISNNVIVDNFVHPAAVDVVWNNTNDPNVVFSGNSILGSPVGTLIAGIGTIGAGNTNPNGSIIPPQILTGFGQPSLTIDLRNATGNQTVKLTKPYQTVEGGAGLLTITDPSTAPYATIVGGSGGISGTISGGGSSIYTAPGSTNTMTLTGSDNIGSAGNDTIVETTADHANINVTGTADITNYSSGTSQFYVFGTATVHEMNGYYDEYTVLAGGTLSVVGVMKSDYFQAQGGTVNYNGGANAGSFSGYVDAGSDQVGTMQMTTWDDSALKSPVTSHLTLDRGNYTISVVGDTVIDAGSDAGQVHVSAGGSAKLTFVGGSGSEYVYTGSGGGDVTLGSGTLVVDGVKTGIANIYEINSGSTGIMTIKDFQSGIDHLVLGQGVTIASEIVGKSSLQITMSNHGQVVLPYVSHL